MRRKYSRGISIITVVFMLLTVMVIPMPTKVYGSTELSFTDGVEGGKVYYTVDEETNTVEITGCDLHVTSVKIPSTIDGVTVTSIGYSAFEGCDLTSITIPEGVMYIGSYAFCGTDLTDITIPKGVTIIMGSAFRYCGSLKNITIPDSVTSIGVCAFDGCDNLTSITIPEGITSIGRETFSDCISLTSVTIPKGVTSIGNAAFYGCSSLTSIRIPEGVTSIEGSAFSHCRSLTSITIPDSVTSIGGNAFYFCSSLMSIMIPDSVTSIGHGAFAGSSLTIQGYAGSYAETYAIENNIPFVSWGISNANGTVFALDKEFIEASVGSSCFIFGDLVMGKHDTVDPDDALVWTSSDESILKFAEYQCINSTDDPNDMLVMARFETLKTGDVDITVSLGEQSLTCKVNVDEGLSVPNIAESNPYGMYDGFESTPATQESRAKDVYRKMQDLEEAMNDFYTTVTERFKKEARAANADTTKQQVRELRQYDESATQRRTNPLLTIDPQAPDEAIDDAYEVLYDFLKDCVDTGVSDGIIKLDIDLSDSIVEIEAGVINEVYDLIRDANYDIEGTGTNGYHVELCSAGGLGKRISFGVGSISKGKGITRESYDLGFVSDSRKVAATMNQFIDDLSDAVKNLYKEAALSLWNDFCEKSCIKEVTQSMLEDYLKDKAEYLIQKGYGKLLKTFTNIKKGETFLREVTSIHSPTDAVKKIQSGDMDKLLSQISKLEYTDKELVSEVVKNSLARVESARATLQRALLDYLYNEDTKGSLNPIEKMKYFFKSTFQCPVDVEVYDESGRLLGAVIDGEATYEEGIYIELDGDVKTVYFPKDMKVSFKLTGSDTGSMNYVLEEYEEGLPTGRMNYYDVPLTDGIEYSQTLNGTGLPTDVASLPLTRSDGGSINADEYISAETKTANVEITGTVEGSGAAAGAGVYAKGDPVTLTAIAGDGSRFKGWYNDEGELLEHKPNYRFTALSDTNVIARFIELPVKLTNYNVKLSEKYQGDANIMLYKAGDKAADLTISLYDSELAEDLDVTLVKYGQNKVVVSKETAKAVWDGGYRFVVERIPLDDWCTLEILESSGSSIGVVSLGGIPDENEQQPGTEDSTGGGNVQQPGTSGNQSKDTQSDIPAKKPENLKNAMTTISGLKFYVDTKTDRTAAITGMAKNNKKTITIKDTVTVNGVEYKVTAIGGKAFKNCRKVTKIVVPASVKIIKKNAFAGAKKLKQIVFKGKKAITIKEGAFNGLNTKKMTALFNKKMTKKEFAKMKKTLKKAGFKGKVKKTGK